MLLIIYVCGFVICFIALRDLGSVAALLRALIWPIVFFVMFLQWISNLTAVDDPDDNDSTDAP
jgi:hypothetical protein